MSDLASAALEAARRQGAQLAELRAERIVNQAVALRDGELEGSADEVELGLSVRVIHDGAIGFAGSVELTPEAAAACAAQAIEIARLTRQAGSGAVELADEPTYGEVHWEGPYRRDPTTVPLAERVALLGEWSRGLLASDVVDHVTTSLHTVAEEKYLATMAGTVALQRRVRIHPTLEALAIASDGSFETMRTLAPPTARGYEYLEGEGWDFPGELAELPEHLAAKLAAPSVEPGHYDLVIDPTNLWLTIHESIGHATELDRALGYEAAYAGTSFATFDQLNTLVYGSPLMQVSGDRTAEFGLATIGWDDEGVATQRFDLVRDGRLVGYQLDRRIAAEAHLARSNGCAFSASPLMIPIQRMANVSLQPAGAAGPSTEELISGVERGIYVVGDKSWSIDMQRHNFQFTGQRFYRIEHGRLAGQVKDVAYQSRTTDFWGAMNGVGGTDTYLLAGAMNCGKGQPGQVAPVSHGCPSARFRQVNVLNTRAESGR